MKALIFLLMSATIPVNAQTIMVENDDLCLKSLRSIMTKFGAPDNASETKISMHLTYPTRTIVMMWNKENLDCMVNIRYK